MAGESFATAPEISRENPYFWAMPTQQPRPNEAGKISAEGLAKAATIGGKTLGEGISDLDKAEERGIMNDVYKRGDDLMNRDIHNLYAEYQDSLGQRPSEIDELPRNIETIKDARANGKLSNTDHDARIDALAKEMRAKYPGYRQEVDEITRAATGRGSTANQLYSSLREDIDATTAARKAQSSKVENELWSMIKEGVGTEQDNAAIWLQQYKAGNMDEFQVAQRIQKAMSIKYQEMQDRAFIAHSEAQGAQRKDIAVYANKAITQGTDDVVAQGMDHVLFAVGNGKQETINQMTEDLANGKLPMSSEQAETIALQMDAYEQKLYQQQWSKYQQGGMPGQPGLSSYLAGGDKDFKGILDKSFERWHAFRDLITKDKDLSLASATHFMAERAADDAHYDLMTDPATANYSRYAAGISKFGPAVGPIVAGNVLSDKTLTTGIQKKLLSSNMQFALPESMVRETGDTKPSLSSTIDDLRAMKAPPQAYTHIMDLIGTIPNSKFNPELRANIAQSIFGINNRGVINKFSGVEDVHGVTDQQKFFDQMTSPKMTKEIYKLSQTMGTPLLWDNYKEWAQHDWHAFVQNTLTDAKSYEQLPAFEFGYDDTTHHIVARPNQQFLDKNSRFMSPVERERLVRFHQGTLNNILKRLNGSIDNMGHIFEQTGDDLNVSLVQMLRGVGVPDDVFGKQIIQAIEHTLKQR